MKMQQTFEQILEIEKEKMDELFILSKQQTKDGELARQHINKICYDYTHR